MELIKKWLITLAIISVHLTGLSQDSLVYKSDNPSQKKDTSGEQINPITPKADSSKLPLNPKTYLILLGSDLRQQVTKPFHLKKKRLGNVRRIYSHHFCMVICRRANTTIGPQA
jgi:hypothetical protein